MPARTERPLRADARRNRDAIVTAAGEAFAEAGTQASLDDIAVRAGVGNATLYRHFPTRDSLLVAALHHRLAGLAEIAAGLGKVEDLDVALREWFFAMADHLRTWSGLPDSVVHALRTGESPLTDACQPLRATTGVFLDRAKAAGLCRPELRTADVFTIMAALAWAADKRGDTDDGLRLMIDTVLVGMYRS
jgi:AcrR family transcriptional regulator